ncbi:MAG: phenylalanine--tRNA ligase [Candidatus Parcubacteria bacterium]|jgi:phenylalanyl-tRNA synthetase beta subunit
MKFSYNWLQTHIQEKLPTPEVISQTLTHKCFEVDGIEKLADDYVFDVKILPDRSHDAAAHRVLARELCYYLELTYLPQHIQDKAGVFEGPKLAIQDTQASPRFMARSITALQAKESPKWLVDSLEAIGQRSINPIVDITNYVLYDLGKPIHAFDADKIVGTITTRFAKEGETVVTLDGKYITLDSSILVLADEEGPLDIAGIKGGKKAEVTHDTTHVIIVSSNFNSSLIRKTTQKVGIKTDAARRFENGITSELCAYALEVATALTVEIAGTDKTETSINTDIYPKPEKRYKVGVSTSEINRVLGTTLSDTDIAQIFTKRGFSYVYVKNVRENIKTVATQAIGKKYKRGASVLYDAPDVFDCSSLTAYAYSESGIAIPRISVDQFVYGTDTADIEVGDILCINSGIIKSEQGTYYSQVLQKDIAECAIRTESVEWMPGTQVLLGIDHVGIYMGEGVVVHAHGAHGAVVKESIVGSVFEQGAIYKKLLFSDEGRFVVSAPFERLDIRIKEDLIDEVSKWIGTDTGTPKNTKAASVGEVTKKIHYTAHIRNFLKQEGYSEIMTTSFSDEGDIAIQNSVDPKKNHLRKNLQTGLLQALHKASYNSLSLGIEFDPTVRLFEIGNIFSGENTEETHICIGVITKNKKEKKQVEQRLKDTLSKLLNTVSEEGLSLEASQITSQVMSTDEVVGYSMIEISIDELVVQLPEKNTFVPLVGKKTDTIYQTLSVFPFITRDIAVFVPSEVDLQKLEDTLLEKGGELCTKIYQFDRFQKTGEERISFGYRLVFQVADRTLSDNEIEPIMTDIYATFSSLGWEVR